MGKGEEGEGEEEGEVHRINVKVPMYCTVQGTHVGKVSSAIAYMYIPYSYMYIVHVQCTCTVHV